MSTLLLDGPPSVLALALASAYMGSSTWLSPTPDAPDLMPPVLLVPGLLPKRCTAPAPAPPEAASGGTSCTSPRIKRLAFADASVSAPPGGAGTDDASAASVSFVGERGGSAAASPPPGGGGSMPARTSSDTAAPMAVPRPVSLSPVWLKLPRRPSDT